MMEGLLVASLGFGIIGLGLYEYRTGKAFSKFGVISRDERPLMSAYFLFITLLVGVVFAAAGVYRAYLHSGFV
jgi:hypothetical protein